MIRTAASIAVCLVLVLCGHLIAGPWNMACAGPPGPTKVTPGDNAAPDQDNAAPDQDNAAPDQTVAPVETEKETAGGRRDLLMPPGFSPKALRGGSDPRLEKMIRDAIDGKQTPGESGMSSQMLDLLRAQSILRGSVLDEVPTQSVAEQEFSIDQEFSNAPKTGPDGCVGDEKHENQLRTVELLLRAARQLSKIGPPDADRTELVKRMRRQAARLLASSLDSPHKGQASDVSIQTPNAQGLKSSEIPTAVQMLSAPPSSKAPANFDNPASNPPPADPSLRP